MCRSDFLSLSLIFRKCKSTDLFEVDTDEIPCAFLSRCDKLERFVFPSNLKYIREFAFQSCYNLEINKLPESLESIGFCAFENCWKLNLTIPDKILVCKGAFGDCPRVKLPEHILLPEDMQFSETDSHEVSVVQSQIASKSIFSSIITFLFSLFTKSRIY